MSFLQMYSFVQIKRGGRPKIGTWMKDHIPEVQNVVYDLQIPLLLVRQNNKHLDQCLCVYCEKILVGPLLFRACEHAACQSCFLDVNFKTPITDTVCPKCSVKVSEKDLIASTLLQSCIDNLIIICDPGKASFVSSMLR